MVILAVDYGDARTGVAVCDKFEMLASPVSVIHEKNAEKLAEQIANLNIDNALLQSQLNTANARIKELEEQE